MPGTPLRELLEEAGSCCLAPGFLLPPTFWIQAGERAAGGVEGGLRSPGFSLRSYLGLGLMSARLAVLGGEEGKPGEWGAVFRALPASRTQEPQRAPPQTLLVGP